MEISDVLKKGQSRFVLVGKAVLGNNALEDETTSNSGWVYANTSFGVDTTGEKSDGNKNVVYVQFNATGGYRKGQPIKVFGRNRGEDGKSEQLNIPFDKRLDEDLIDQVSLNNIYRADLGEGEKKFITNVDFLHYLQEHLHEGMDVVVTGEVSYSNADPTDPATPTYRNYIVKRVALNKPRKEKNDEGETVEVLSDPTAYMVQEVLITEDTLDPRWEKELEKGETLASVYVAEYISQIRKGGQGSKQYVDYKKVVPLSQPIVIKKGTNPKSVKAIFTPKDKDAVRAIQLICQISDGYEMASGDDVEITDDIQELIDLGMLTLDQVKAQLMVRGPRKHEIVFENISLYREENDDGNRTGAVYYENKFSPKVLELQPIENVIKDDGESSILDEGGIDLDSEDIASLFGD